LASCQCCHLSSLLAEVREWQPHCP
jgi:hypothetical protein